MLKKIERRRLFKKNKQKSQMDSMKYNVSEISPKDANIESWARREMEIIVEGDKKFLLM